MDRCIAALTVVTALCVIGGTYPAGPSTSREIEPLALIADAH